MDCVRLCYLRLYKLCLCEWIGRVYLLIIHFGKSQDKFQMV